MNLSLGGLQQLLQNGVVELRFTRRHPVKNRPATRRMVASLSSSILDSDLGRNVLNFKPTSGRIPYNPTSYNLLIVFDIFMQDWRAIPVNQTEVIKVLPSSTLEEFSDYFFETLAKMTSAQKAAFMDQ